MPEIRKTSTYKRENRNAPLQQIQKARTVRNKQEQQQDEEQEQEEETLDAEAACTSKNWCRI